jgi:hypothetical protein
MWGLLCFILPLRASAEMETKRRDLQWKNLHVQVIDPHPYRVYSTSEPTEAKILVTSQGQKTREATLRIQVAPFGVDPLPDHEIPLLIQPGQSRLIELEPFLETLQGHAHLRFSLQDDKGTSEEAELAVVRMESAGPPLLHPGTMRFGIAYGASGGGDFEAELMSRVGFNIVRLNPHWSRVQRKGPNEWNWGWYDQQVEAHTSRGMEVQAIIHGFPHWAKITSENGTGAIPDLELWRTWVEAVATHLKGRASYWELWNEPDIAFFKGTVDEYVALYTSASEIIRKVDPDTQIMTGGFASINHGRYKEGIIERTLREGPEYFDVFCYHRHGYFQKFYDEMENQILPLLRAELEEVPPLYFSETSMDTRFGEAHQAQTAVKKMAYAWSIGAVSYTWFNFADKTGGSEANRPGRTYGLLTNDFYPKPSLVAIHTFISLLKRGRYVESWELPPDQHAYVFKAEDRYIVVAWNEEKGQPGAEVVVETKGGQVGKIDIMGRRHPVSSQGEPLQISLENDAVFYEFEHRPTLLAVENEEEIGKARAMGELIPLPRSSEIVTLELDSAQDVYNYFEDDPHTIDTLWKGPEDLSARLRMKWEDGLIIRATVQDDEWEMMKEDPAMGDSVEITLGSSLGKSVVTLAPLEEDDVFVDIEGPQPTQTDVIRTEASTSYTLWYSLTTYPNLAMEMNAGFVRFGMEVRDRDNGELSSLLRTSGSEGNKPLYRLNLE